MKNDLILNQIKSALVKLGYDFRWKNLNSNVAEVSGPSGEFVAAIRRAPNGSFGFRPSDGEGWVTLDKVNAVIVGALDHPEHPKQIAIYMFPANEVRLRQNLARTAQANAGVTKWPYGCQISLKKSDEDGWKDVGSGLGDDFPPISVVALSESQLGKPEIRESVVAKDQTIADVLAAARGSIASLAGVEPSAVKLQLNIDL